MSKSNRSYWMFIVLEEWFPGLWKKMVKRGLAAEHYPPGWKNERRNIELLSQIRREDLFVAAFRGYRFGGYGKITSAFDRGGPSLGIPASEGECLSFRERLGCDWRTLPLDGSKLWIDCSDLKDRHNIKLRRGCCVKEIDEEAFTALKAMLDNAGAVRPG